MVLFHLHDEMFEISFPIFVGKVGCFDMTLMTGDEEVGARRIDLRLLRSQRGLPCEMRSPKKKLSARKLPEKVVKNIS